MANLSCSSNLADYDWLTGDEAGAWLRELSANPQSLHSAADRLRKQLSPDRTHLLLEQVELRARAAAKFTRPERMFFTRTALEQATDQWVAAYKATRLAGRGPLADLCCGIGGDLLSLADVAETVGVDQSPFATLLAAANVGAVRQSESRARVSLQTVEVGQFSLADFAAWHLDPDRRPAGGRTTSLDWSNPPLSTVEALLAAVPDGAIKMAPAAEIPAEWSERCELEWIGRDRQCRQLVAWHGALAQSPGLRRATVLPSNHAAQAAVRSFVGEPNVVVPIAERLERFVFDTDPTIVAARLNGALAAEHGLAAVAAGPAYFTGPEAIADEALACFEVEEVLPAKMRALAQSLEERGIGALEIKKRGVDLDPERVRRELKLRGEKPATLLFTMLAGRQVAILARRITSQERLPDLCPLTSEL
jgi:THUMP domain-like